MDSPKLLLPILSFFLLFLLSGQVSAVYNHTITEQKYLFHSRPTKLFVFGDSYADTGNNNRDKASSWKFPYGISFPGKPSGRYSNGRVLTDFLAKFIGLKTPLTYEFQKNHRLHEILEGILVKHGMNFACGGTGVFNTLVSDPNMTLQIDNFQRLVRRPNPLFNAYDVSNSVALVTVSGNDYSAYLARNGSTGEFPTFISKVVGQISVNLKRINDLGVKKIVVTGLQPLGCLPENTVGTKYQKCNDDQNKLVGLHNMLLQEAVVDLKKQTNSSIIILNLFDNFMSVIKGKSDIFGKFDNPLKPCCAGISSGYFCGDVAKNGTKMFTVCENPEAAFFWDTAHPTQRGWAAIYNALRQTIHQFVQN
ncbi:hypothetical protein UlMin_005574 [Ulmus minor]